MSQKLQTIPSLLLSLAYCPPIQRWNLFLLPWLWAELVTYFNQLNVAEMRLCEFQTKPLRRMLLCMSC